MSLEPLKKFKRKERLVPKKDKAKPEVEEHDDNFFEEFTKASKEIFKNDLIVPTGASDSLLEVNDWIPMPKVLTDLMDAQGLPCGLIATAYGLPDCGKTTFANTALKNTQDEGGVAVLIKTEDKYSLKRAEAMGIDVKKMHILRPLTIEAVGEQIAQIMKLLQSKPKWAHKKVCIVWDSLAATPCASELNEKRKDFSMDAAKAVRGMLRKVSALIKTSNVSFLVINQVYDNTNSFGEKTTQYGGKGVLYHSAIMLKFAAMGRIRPNKVKSGEGDFCGIKTMIEVKKNHLGQPFKTAEVQIDWRGFVFDRSPEYAPSTFKKEEEDESDDDTELPETKKKRVKGKHKASSD